MKVIKNQELVKFKQKQKIDNEEDKDYSEFQNSAKKIITVLRLSIAKIKNDIQKGTLLFQKK